MCFFEDVGQLHGAENDAHVVAVAIHMEDAPDAALCREDDRILLDLIHLRCAGFEMPNDAVGFHRADRFVAVIHHDDARLIGDARVGLRRATEL